MMARWSVSLVVCIVVDTGAFAEALLHGMRDGRKPFLKRDQCLKFMHIPKTGGSTIDRLNLMKPTEHRAFQSYMTRVFDSIAEKEQASASANASNNHSRLAGEIFGEVHEDIVKYVEWMTAHHDDYVYKKLPGGAMCTVHTPPIEPETMAYFNGSCTRFCVVRDPLRRFLSTFQYDFEFVEIKGSDVFKGLPPHLVRCSVASFERWLPHFLKRLRQNPYQMLCHWNPQVEMVYGRTSGFDAAGASKYCDRVLRQENLAPQFDKLMREFHRNIRLNDLPRIVESPQRCNIRVEDVSQRAKDLVYEYYRADYQAFGYARP